MQPDLSCPPPPTEVPMFPPLRPALSRRYRWRRALRPRRRTAAVGLAVAAAALAVSGHAAQPPTAVGAAPPGPAHGTTADAPAAPPGAPRPPGGAHGDGTSAGGGEGAGPAAVAHVSAPVRIGDAAAVRLLSAGDRVDVLAMTAPAPAGPTSAGRTSAAGSDPASGSAPAARSLARCARVVQIPIEEENTWSGVEGALVVLDVPRPTASRIAGAAAAGPLAVALC
ncbi:hypothetical protein QNO07_24680 [Streptomyces sp. 549]|uniref:hypothetical protein n=1 Tax=Streptomyces sp. 549 TaxID=3049076 RepID=UPI0024C45077|nr:hypothetical protein [Streptomyces sp. 549]MDK1476561.1 hypothetical protein [Streptomyces sp. 549]